MFRRGPRSRWRTIGTWLAIMAAINAFANIARARRSGGGESRGDAGIHLSGLGNSGNRINLDARAARIAEFVIENGIADPVSDETLSAVWAAVLERAETGDVDAAAVLFEVARRQRAEAAAA